MKKLLTFTVLCTICITSLLIHKEKSYVAAIFAQTPTNDISLTPSPTPAPSSIQSAIEKQLNSFKQKVANEVAKHNTIAKRGFIGTITNVKNTEITVTDIKGNTRIIDVDELTKFSSSTNQNIGISNLLNGTTIGILGQYNKDTTRTLARFINVLTTAQSVHGIIVSIDRTNGLFDVFTNNSKKQIIDVESLTKIYTFTKDTNLVKSGLSKLSTQTEIIASGYTNKNNSSEIVATRVIAFPNGPVNPRISVPSDLQNNDTITPSTGSGNKLIPLKPLTR